METVTIRVRPDQRDRIEELKVYPRETVSDVLDRLINRYLDGRIMLENSREAQEQR